MHAPASPWAPAAVAGYTTTRALKGMGSSEQNNSKSNRINNKRKTKDLATEYAKDVDGVKDVKNEMAVSAPAKKTQTAGDQIDDASITGLAKMTLLYHRSTSALNTSVTTKNGVVTLTGKAKNAKEIIYAANSLNNCVGCRWFGSLGD